MAKKSLPLSKVYSLLESGPVIMVTTGKIAINLNNEAWPCCLLIISMAVNLQSYLEKPNPLYDISR